MNDIREWKKIRNCVPFIDNGVGVKETQAAIDEMLAEVERLRARCGRLTAAVEAWRQHDETFSTLVGIGEINRLLRDADFYRLSGLVSEAMQRVKDDNDLKEPTDG